MINVRSLLGARGDGIIDDHGAIQMAITIAASTGEGVYIPPLPSGYKYLISSGLVIPSSAAGVRIFTDGGPGSATLKYTGSGAAVTFGDPGQIQYRCGLERISIDLSSAGANAIGLLAVQTASFYAHRVQIYTQKGGPLASGQIGIKLDGGPIPPAGSVGFSAYSRIEMPEVSGNFLYGIRITGLQPSTNNSGQIVGGVIGGTASQAPGTIAVYVDNADTWIIDGPDLTGWATGLQVNSNFSKRLDVRCELNTMDRVITGYQNTVVVYPFDNPLKNQFSTSTVVK